MKNKITIVGCGPGAPEMMTLTAKEIIRNSTVVMGTARLLANIEGERMKRITLSAYTQEAIKQIEKELEQEDVTVMVTGDSLLFSLGNTLYNYFKTGNVRLIPGISSVQLAYARLELPLHNMMTFSAHGRIPALVLSDLKKLDSFAILCGTKQGQDFALELQNKLSAVFKVKCCIDLSLATEQIIDLTEETSLFSRMVVVFYKDNL